MYLDVCNKTPTDPAGIVSAWSSFLYSISSLLINCFYSFLSNVKNRVTGGDIKEKKKKRRLFLS